MKNYLVIITIDDPYPKKFTYRTEGSSFAVGVAKALRTFRKEFKGHRIKNGNIHFEHYASTTTQ